MPAENQSLVDMILGGSTLNIGGGSADADRQLALMNLLMPMQLGRQQFGGDLVSQMLGIRANPLNLVTSLNLAGQAGGGTGAIGAALAGTGGAGFPTGEAQFPGLDQAIANLLQQQTTFAGGAPINPNTGLPYTPNEMAFLERLVAQEQGFGAPTPVRDVGGAVVQEASRATPRPQTQATRSRTQLNLPAANRRQALDKRVTALLSPKRKINGQSAS